MKYGKIYLILLKVTRALKCTIKIAVYETLSDLLNHVFPLAIHFCNMEIVNTITQTIVSSGSYPNNLECINPTFMYKVGSQL